MNGNVENAEDAFSQVTLKAWEQLFIHADKITHLKAWLIRFTYNFCMDIHRAKARISHKNNEYETQKPYRVWVLTGCSSWRKNDSV